MRRRRRFEWTFIALAAPAILIFGAFLFFPVVGSFAFSFTRWDGINLPSFIGLENFARLTHDSRYLDGLLHTAAFAAIILVGQIASGLGLALLLNRNRRGTAFARATFFTPVLLSTAVIALAWGFIFNPLVGVVSAFAKAIGAAGTPLGALLGNPTSALWAVSFVVIWQYAGYTMVIYLAGLKNIAAEVGEAADLDGASGFQRFRLITWPLLAPSTAVAVTISLAGNLRLFDQVYLLTGGGPAGSTETAAILIYRTAFSNSNFGYSAAQSVVLTIIITVIVFGQRWLSARRSRL